MVIMTRADGTVVTHGNATPGEFANSEEFAQMQRLLGLFRGRQREFQGDTKDATKLWSQLYRDFRGGEIDGKELYNDIHTALSDWGFPQDRINQEAAELTCFLIMEATQYHVMESHRLRELLIDEYPTVDVPALWRIIKIGEDKHFPVLQRMLEASVVSKNTAKAIEGDAQNG
jgi:uncharacterized protein with HEPN domain